MSIMTNGTKPECDHLGLREHLVRAIAEAERCDPVVAIHIETALAVLDERFGRPH